MKKFSITALALLGLSISANAGDFTANVGDQPNQFPMEFDWVVPNETCKFAAGNLEVIKKEKFTTIYPDWNNWQATQVPDGYEYKVEGQGPNELDWHIGNYGFPTEVEYNGKKIKIVGIGNYSFANRVNIDHIKIPESYSFIGDGAFYGWNHDGTLDLGNVDKIGDFAFFGGKCKTLNFPPSLREIGKMAFGDWQNITEVSIDCPFLELGEGVFSGCSGIKTVNIQSIKTLGESAFEDCQSIETIVIGDGVTEIKPRAFYNCDPTSITIGNNVVTIGDYAFYNCQKLIELNLGEKVKTIGDYAFYDCSLLQYLVIPDSVYNIGNYAFYDCSKLCDIIFGKNIRKIGNYAFYYAHVDCTDSLYLPGNIEEIGYMALAFNRTATGPRDNGCLTDLYISTPVPPTLPSDENGMTAFGDYDPVKVGDNFYNVDNFWEYPYLCLHVPVGSREAYANAPGWKNFQCIIEDVVEDNAKLGNVVAYVFMTPEEKLNLTSDVLRQADTEGTQWDIWVGTDENGNYKPNWDYWELADPTSDIVTLDDATKGDITANKFGQVVVVARRDDGNRTFQEGTTWKDAEDTVTAAVIVFVCPTITLVYDNEEAHAEKPAVYKAGATGDDDSQTTLKDITANYVTYEHIVAYNSLPKLDIEPVKTEDVIELELSNIPKGIDEVKTVDASSLKDLLEEIQEKQYSEDGKVVPIDPISNNRVIHVTMNIQKETPTSVDAVLENTNIRIKTNGTTISIEGADPDEEFTIFNVDGQVIYSGTNKTVEMPGRGIYAGKIGDKAFKITVR